MTEHTDPDDERVSDDETDRIPFSRRDVMKAAGTTTVVGVTATGSVGAQTSDCNCETGTTQCVVQSDDCSYCKINDPSGTCVIPGTDIEITLESSECITLSDPDDAVSLVALKSGSQCPCTTFSGSELDAEMCTSCDQNISHVTVEYDCENGSGEVCEYDNISCEVTSADCSQVVASVSNDDVDTDISADCPVDAILYFEEGDCSSMVVEDITSPGDVTFDGIDGCCTPDTVEITLPDDPTTVLATCDVTLSEEDLPCGYDDLAFENVEFCCDEVTFDVSGIECEVDYTLSFSEGDCTAESGTLTSDDNDTTVSITWVDCCTPEKVVLTTTTNGGQEIATLEPDSPLNCVCESFETCRFETEETPLPPLGETATFTCGDVDITVETTNINDGEASCFEIVSVSEPLFGKIVVKGAGMQSEAITYDLDDCGQTEFTEEFCAPVNASGKNSAISYWEVTICTEDLTTECVPGTVLYPNG